MPIGLALQIEPGGVVGCSRVQAEHVLRVALAAGCSRVQADHVLVEVLDAGGLDAEGVTPPAAGVTCAR